jgi:hypothetical protein
MPRPRTRYIANPPHPPTETVGQTLAFVTVDGPPIRTPR